MAGDLKARISLDGSDQVKRDLQQFGQAGQDAFNKISEAAARTNTDRLNQQVGALRTGMTAAGQAAASAGNSISNAFGSIASGVGGAISSLGSVAATLAQVGAAATLVAGGVAAAAIAATNALAQASADSAAAIGDAADRLGTTPERLQKIQAIAESTGLSTEKFAGIMDQLSTTLDKAQAGMNQFGTAAGQVRADTFQSGVQVLGFSSALAKTGLESDKAVKALADLGVKLRDVNGQKKDTVEVMLDIRDAFSRLPDGPNKARIALDLFGKKLIELKPFFNASRADIQQFAEDFDKSNRKLTNAQVQQAQDFKAAQGELQSAIKATRDQLGLLFVPGKTATASFLSEIIDKSRPATLALAALVQQKVALFARDNLDKFLSFFEEVKASVNSIAEAIGPTFSALKGTLTSIATQGIDILAVSLSKLTGLNITPSFTGLALSILSLTRSFGLASIAIQPVIAGLTVAAGLVGGFGPASILAGLAVIAFWDQFKQAGVAAYRIIRENGDDFKQFFRDLAKGDFTTAFETLQRVGVRAFDILKAEAPGFAFALQRAFTTVRNIGNDIRDLFGTLRSALQVTAGLINGIFGTNLTASSLAFYLAVGKVTGALSALGSVTFIAANALRALGIPLALVLLVLVKLQSLGTFDAIRDLATGLKEIAQGNVLKGITDVGDALKKLGESLSKLGFAGGALLVAGIVSGFALVRSGLVALGLLSGRTIAINVVAGAAEGVTAGVAAAGGGAGVFAGLIAAAKVAGALMLEALAVGVIATAVIASIVVASKASQKAENDLRSAIKDAEKARADEFNKNLEALKEKDRILGDPIKLPAPDTREFTKGIEDDVRSILDDLKSRQLPPPDTTEFRTKVQELGDFAADALTGKTDAAARRLADEGGESLRAAFARSTIAAKTLKEQIQTTAETIAEPFKKAGEDVASASEAASQSVKKSYEKAVDAVRKLGKEQVGDAGQKAALKELGDEADDADEEVEKLGNTVEATAEKLNRSSTSLRGYKQDLHGIGEEIPLLGSGGVTKEIPLLGSLKDDLPKIKEDLDAAGNAAAEAGQKVRTLSTADDFKNAKDAAAQLGVTVDGVSEKIRVFSDKNLHDFGKDIDTSPAKKALQDLGDKAEEQSQSVSASIKQLLSKMVEESKKSIDELNQSLDKGTDKTVSDVKTKFADLGDDIGKEITDGLQKAGDAAQQGGIFNTDKLRPSSNVEDRRPGANEFQDRANDAQQAFDQIKQAAQDTAAALDQTFGLSLEGIGAQFQALGPSVVAVVGTIKNAFGDVPSAFGVDAQSAVQVIADAFGTLPEIVAGAFSGVASTVEASFQEIENAAQTLVQNITAQMQQLQQTIAATLASAQQAQSAASSSSGSSDTSGFASGGYIQGPGTSTSDSILARLSRGEYVVRAAVVDKLGVGFFHALNAFRSVPKSLAGFPAFAQGGLVNDIRVSTPTIPQDNQRAMQRLELSLAGQVVGDILAPKKVVEKMAKFSTSVQMRSLGARPGWAR